MRAMLNSEPLFLADAEQVISAEGRRDSSLDATRRVASARQAGIDVQYRVISEAEMLTYYPSGVNQLVSAASEARPGRVR